MLSATLSGITYSSIDIALENDKDGGTPGGNIRVAYLYNPAVLSLTLASPVHWRTHSAISIPPTWRSLLPASPSSPP